MRNDESELIIGSASMIKRLVYDSGILMKAMKCEICGSSDLTKKDGMFVCDYCGTKYTAEEARNMMIDGTVDVTGTVKIDISSQNRSRMQLAYDAYIDKDYDKANQLLDEVVLNDSTISDAWYLKALIYKDSNWELIERYETRGDENIQNNLGFITKERYEELKTTKNVHFVSMGYLNETRLDYITVYVDDKVVADKVPLNNPI